MSSKYSPEVRSYIWLPESVLNRIATEYYGKTYIAQQTGDRLSNDSFHVYEMDEDSVAMWKSDMESEPRRHYLGVQHVAKGTGDFGRDFAARYAEGVNWFEYWSSLTFDPEKSTVYLLPDQSNALEALESQRTPRSWEDGRGFVYKYESEVYRKAPTPNYVLADLISNGILPYGSYLVKVSW